jgi:aspartyl protease family protein
VNELPRTLKIATVWMIVGLVVFLAIQTFQSRAERSRFSVQGEVIEIRRAGDGHYHWPGSLNGRPVDFLIDTGATGTAIPRQLADEVGLTLEGSVRSSTAGGTVQGALARADVALEGGVRVDRLRVTVLPALEAPLLGMDVLGRLRWSQHQGVLRIDSGEGAP